MLTTESVAFILEKCRFTPAVHQKRILQGSALIGLLTGAVGFFMGKERLVWQALLVNAIFFGGLSIGTCMFSVIFTITKARWGRPLKRLSEAAVAFYPVAALLFVALFWGADLLFEWTDPHKVMHSKEGWLNFPFFAIRNILLLLLFGLFGWLYLKSSLRPDLGLAKHPNAYRSKFADLLLVRFGDMETEREAAEKRCGRLAPVVAVLFVLLSTLLALDWMMSLDQEWFSTLFAVQYLVSNLMAGAAFLMIVSGYLREKTNQAPFFCIKQYHDISKLTFSACLLWTYMVFSQVLVVWYGNLPEETPYLVMRMQSEEWGWLFWLIGCLLFLIPLFGLIGRIASSSIRFSRVVAVIILVGAWLEKYLLIVPSVQENQIDPYATAATLPGFELNPIDIGITVGVLGAFLLCFAAFLQATPTLPITDRYFDEQSAP